MSQRKEHSIAEAVVRDLAAPGHVTMTVTWWAEDGTERRGFVNVAPHASPETLAALTRMLHAAERELSSEGEPC